MIDRSRPAGGGAPLPTILDMFGSLPQFHLIDPLGKPKGAHTLVTILLSSVGLRLTNINAYRPRSGNPAGGMSASSCGRALAWPIGEACEDVAQAAQALVDGLRLLEASIAGCSRAGPA